MSISFRRQSVLILLLILALAVPQATAAAQSQEMTRPDSVAQTAPPDVLGRLWSFLATLLGLPNTLQLDSGCMMDPNGRCTSHSVAPPAQTTQGDTGCMMDPSGRCRG